MPKQGEGFDRFPRVVASLLALSEAMPNIPIASRFNVRRLRRSNPPGDTTTGYWGIFDASHEHPDPRA